MRYLEAVEKVIETGGSRNIISERAFFFLLQNWPIIISPLSFSPLHGRVIQKSRKQAKRDSKAEFLSHDNKNDLGIPNPLVFQVGTY